MTEQPRLDPDTCRTSDQVVSENAHSETLPVTPDTTCLTLSNDGHPCRKPLYLASSGEVWDHAGGHWFASDETHRRMTTEHYDAGRALAGLPFTTHPPEDCPGPPACIQPRGRTDHRA